ncbi:MAG: patatin [Bradyrhizobiaceae bacterium]|nr:MAG: patatin [Bradyrhizobiaceae bacterium]
MARGAASLPGTRRSFALALGGGGARALAQIAVIEALDEMGVRPAAIAGTSMGAAIGAAYAAGMTGRAIRRHVIALAHNRGETLARLAGARIGKLADLWPAALGNPLLVDGERFAAAILPAELPESFAALEIPLTVVATDLHGRGEAAFSDGPLRQALAASMAVPGLVRPVRIGERICVDGGAVNPLPFDHLHGRADVLVAVDSSAGPLDAGVIPNPFECVFATITTIGHTLMADRLAQRAPDLVIRPNIGIFRLLDVFQASAILRAAEPVKAEVKEKLGALLA